MLETSEARKGIAIETTFKHSQIPHRPPFSTRLQFQGLHFGNQEGLNGSMKHIGDGEVEYEDSSGLI